MKYLLGYLKQLLIKKTKQFLFISLCINLAESEFQPWVNLFFIHGWKSFQSFNHSVNDFFLKGRKSRKINLKSYGIVNGCIVAIVDNTVQNCWSLLTLFQKKKTKPYHIIARVKCFCQSLYAFTHRFVTFT